MLDGEPHSASVIALEPTEALMLGRAEFEQLFETQPSIRRSLVLALAGQLRRLTAHVEALHFLDLSARLAQRIEELALSAPGVESGAGGPHRLALDPG